MEINELRTDKIMDLDDRQYDVYKILLMNIKPINRLNNMPYIESDTINSGEIYIPPNSKTNGNLDADMSDIAILFYETIYDSITILKEKRIDLYNKNVRANVDRIRNPKNLNFMGDTMITSFDGFNYHHCLANFWVLPYKIGRTLDPEFGRGNNKTLDDKMDGFLKDLKKRKTQYSDRFRDYFNIFGIGDAFYEKHFLNDSFVINNDEIKEINSIQVAEKAICNRAYKISKEKGEDLYNLFLKIGIIGARRI